MKIIEFKAERFKRLSAVEITPNGNTVVISGRNGQGKSSVLDAIWLALGGGPAVKDSATTRPVKDGEKDAFVRLDLGEIIVTRKWTAAGNSTLTVEGADGRKFNSPQALLDSLVGGIAFDPLSFSRMPARDQRKQLIDLANLSIDPDELDAKRKSLYDERTAINREAKALEAELSNTPRPGQDVADQEISISDLVNEMTEAQRKATDFVNKKVQLENMRKDALVLSELINTKKTELEKLIADGKTLAAEVADIAEPDIQGLQSKMSNVEQINADVRQKKRYLALKTRVSEKVSMSDAITKQIETLDKTKEDAFKTAKFPIEGLAFDNEGITFSSVPFRQCSSAEQMKVCIAIAAALNPKIRVIRVSDASLLDAESMAMVSQLAQEQDMQIWLERVTDGTEKVGVVIEDGAVV